MNKLKNRNDIYEIVEGYKLAEDVNRKKRLSALKSMSPKESFSIYKELWMIWESSKKTGNIKALDELKINYLIERRKSFDCLSLREKGA